MFQRQNTMGDHRAAVAVCPPMPSKKWLSPCRAFSQYFKTSLIYSYIGKGYTHALGT